MPTEAGQARDDSDEPIEGASAAATLVSAVDSGILDTLLVPLTEAIVRRLGELRRQAASDIAALIEVGDQVRLCSPIRPTYLEGATATVTGWDEENVLVRLDRPVGRYSTDVDIRLSPLGVRPVAA